MNILFLTDNKLHPSDYQKNPFIWSLGKRLKEKGHNISILAPKGSVCPFAKVHIYNNQNDINQQIPERTDLLHSLISLPVPPQIPWLETVQTNGLKEQKYHLNTVFLSANHAKRHQSTTYVHPSLHPGNYPKVKWHTDRTHLLFIGQAYNKKQNVADCKLLANVAEQTLAIVGSYGYSFSKYINYKGVPTGDAKAKLLNKGKALLMPSRWHIPFDMSIIESMYYGCPVFGSPYGCLPEIIRPEVGTLSTSRSDLLEAIDNIKRFDRKRVHEYVLEMFSAEKMATEYLELYEKVLQGQYLNKHTPISKRPQKSLLPFYD
ncbi:glycosyltransferase [Cytophagaceae bacterium ABcell3]|nr:glycosyltransferase [Cytophagaceae bacterium ABcell3]